MKQSKFIDNKPITLRESNRDENWLHKWIVEKPERLGLGPFEIKAQEVHHYKNKGGRLDILGYAKSTDIYYQIEVMLGECDSEHGFHSLDYWARERINKPNQKHNAVLIAENLQGRYKTLIETLPQFLPFIAIEIRTLKLEGYKDEDFITCYAEIIAQPDELTEVRGIASTVEGKAVLPVDEEWWRENKGNTFVDTAQYMADYCETNVSPSRIDYTANSYISLKKGKRTWLPMWPRQDGFYIYLPDDGTGTADEPSERFRNIQQRLSAIGIDASWVFKYNTGPNPIGFALPKAKMKDAEVLDILKESYSLA